MHVLDRAGGEPRAQLIPIEAADVSGGEGFQFQPAEYRLDVHSRNLLVPFPCPLAHSALNAIDEPAVQVITEFQAVGVEDEAALPATSEWTALSLGASPSRSIRPIQR